MDSKYSWEYITKKFHKLSFKLLSFSYHELSWMAALMWYITYVTIRQIEKFTSIMLQQEIRLNHLHLFSVISLTKVSISLVYVNIMGIIEICLGLSFITLVWSIYSMWFLFYAKQCMSVAFVTGFWTYLLFLKGSICTFSGVAYFLKTMLCLSFQTLFFMTTSCF